MLRFFSVKFPLFFFKSKDIRYLRRDLFGFRINSLKKQLVQRVLEWSKKLNFLLFSIPFGRGFDPWLATIFWKTLWGFHLFWMDCEKSGRWSSIFWADIVRGKPLQNDETNSVLDEKLTDICLENIWKKIKQIIEVSKHLTFCYLFATNFLFISKIILMLGWNLGRVLFRMTLYPFTNFLLKKKSTPYTTHSSRNWRWFLKSGQKNLTFCYLFARNFLFISKGFAEDKQRSREMKFDSFLIHDDGN